MSTARASLPPYNSVPAARCHEPRFVHTFRVGKDVTVQRRYDAETKAEAVRLVQDHREDYKTEWAVISAGRQASSLRCRRFAGM